MSDIAQATLEDALRYYHTYYVPNNAFIVAVGDFDSAALTAQIDEAFGAIASAAAAAAACAPSSRSQHGARRVELKREAQLPFVAMAHHVPNLRSAGRRGARSAVRHPRPAATARGCTSELVYRQRLAREAGASYDYTSIDPGLFTVYAQPLPGKSAAARRRRWRASSIAPRREPPTRARAREGEERHRGAASSSPRTRSSTRRCCSASTRSPATGAASTTTCPHPRRHRRRRPARRQHLPAAREPHHRRADSRSAGRSAAGADRLPQGAFN